MMMYLFTTVPDPHGHWQLQELLGNQCYHVKPSKIAKEETLSGRTLSNTVAPLITQYG